MNAKLPILIAVVSISWPTLGQSVSTLIGARSQGMANSSITLSDEWALWNNPAGLAQHKKPGGAFALHHMPVLLSANRLAALATSPFKFGSFGIGLFRFGDNLYNEHIASIAYSNQLGLASLGFRMDYIQYRAEGYATTANLGLTFGGIAVLTKIVSVGASVVNLNQPKLPNGEPLPVRLTIGTQIKPTTKFLFTTEIEKDLDFAPTFKGGMEYQFHKKFMARTGFNLCPGAGFFGMGFVSWKLRIDYAIQYSRILSHSHQVSVGMAFDTKEKKKE